MVLQSRLDPLEFSIREILIHNLLRELVNVYAANLRKLTDILLCHDKGVSSEVQQTFRP